MIHKLPLLLGCCVCARNHTQDMYACSVYTFNLELYLQPFSLSAAIPRSRNIEQGWKVTYDKHRRDTLNPQGYNHLPNDWRMSLILVYLQSLLFSKRFLQFLEILGGLHRGIIVSLSKARFQYPASLWQITTICSSSVRASNSLFWSQWAPGGGAQTRVVSGAAWGLDLTRASRE